MNQSVRSTLRSVVLLLVVFASAISAHAGTFSTAPWTNDATSYIASGQTAWAFHFGAATTATVNGVNVQGIELPMPSLPEFDLSGIPATGPNDTNNLTALGGTGSAVMATNFIYGGNPGSITVKGLTPGNIYTVSFYSVNWDGGLGYRLINFSSGSDSLVVDQNQFGNENGIRVDYTFTATATTRAFSLAQQLQNNASFHLYGIALRQESAPTVVTNTNDSGTGSLRWALANAADIPGANTVTFDPALSGQSIVTLTEFTVADTGGATIDASALAAPVTISGGGVNNHRLFTHTAGSLTLRRLRLTNGIADASATVGANSGGAVRSTGSGFAAFDCAFINNQGRFTGGALTLQFAGTATIEGCTFSGNVTTADNGVGGTAAAAILNGATLTIRKSTLHLNSTFAGTAGVTAGAILTTDITGNGSVTLEHCTITQNTASGSDSQRAAVLIRGLGSAVITNCIIAENLGGGLDVNNSTAFPNDLHFGGPNIVQSFNASYTGNSQIPSTAAPLLGAFGFNGGLTETRVPLFGSPAIDAAITLTGNGTDQRGFARPFDGDGNGAASPDLGAVESYIPIVSNGNDSGTGSLRQAVADAATFLGADTIYFRSASFPSGGTVNLSTDLAIPASGDTNNVTLATAVTGGNVDVAVNAGTLSFGAGSAWTGGGKILLGATTGSAAATLEIANPNGATSLAAPITVRAGSGGVKTIRDANNNNIFPNTYAGTITLLAPVTIDESGSGKLSISGDVDLGARLLTVTGTASGLIDFSGRLFRGDGIGKAQMVKNGNISLNILGSADNTRLALTVNAGGIVLGKSSSATVHAVGGGLTAADGPALTLAAGTAAIGNAGDQIADTASVSIDGTLSLFGDETIGVLSGSGSVQSGFGNCTLTIGTGDGSGDFGGSLSYGLSIVKVGNGIQTLSGDSGNVVSGMTGSVLLSGGTLNVTGSLARSSGVTVQSGTTLTGNGTAPAATLETGSFLAPGDINVPGSIGTLNVAGSATWNGGVNARFHLSTTDNTSDTLATTGALTKGSAGAFAFDFQGTGLAGQTYTLATFASSNFTAANFSHTGLTPGLVGYFTKSATSLTFTVSTFSPVVTNTADSGPGSLRQVIDDATHIPGPNTITFGALAGQTIALTSEIVFNDPTGAVTLDATGAPGGVTISGGGVGRIFTVSSGQNITLRGLTLTGGNGTGASGGGGGGTIFNQGTLTLTQCTLAGNSGTNGGAILSNGSGTLTLTRCTLSGNSASATGGAILNIGGTLTLSQCTLAGNSAISGGAIVSNGPQALIHCTISANFANEGSGIYSQSTLTLTNSIVSGNTAPGSGSNIANDTGIVTRVGANLVQSLVNLNGGTVTGSGTISTATPLLVALADNGGPTRTMALLSGSPALDAVDAGSIVPIDTDQRGFPRIRDGNAIAGSLPDIGAYEAQVAPYSSAGFNFVGGGAGGPGGTLAASDVAGVPAFAQGNWNNLVPKNDGTAHDGTYPGAGPVPLVDANGTAFNPNLRLWWAGQNLWNISNAVQSTPDRRLMNGYIDSNVAGSAQTVTDLYALPLLQSFFAVTGLPAIPGGYKVVVYCDGDANDRIGEYWMSSNRKANPASIAGETDLTPHVFVRDGANFFDTFTRVPVSSTSDQGTNTPAGNYVVFEGLTEPGFIVRAKEIIISAPINAVQVVRNEIIVVTTALDELDANGTLNVGISLREALRDAPNGAGILFDPALNGATFTLDPAKGEIVLTKDVTIDASNLPGGITIDGGSGTNRIFTVSSGKTVSLVGLRLTGGNAAGAVATGTGGAVLNQGWLTLNACTVSGNSAGGNGGAVSNASTLAVNTSTVSGNASGGSGGGIHNEAIAKVYRSTISGNTATIGGGGIHTEGASGSLIASHSTIAGNSSSGDGGGVDNTLAATTTLTHCTVSGNQAPGGAGGGIRSGSGTFNLVNSIVAGNTATSEADVTGTIVPGGANINGGTPLLAALGNYGGPTQTMALLPASPARNGAVGSTAVTDQRGFPIIGTPDLGAYEAGTFTNFATWSIETAGSILSFGADQENDGNKNGLEYATRTNPFSGNSNPFPAPTPVTLQPGNVPAMQFTFPYRPGATDVRYIIQRSPNNLTSWAEIYRLDLTNNTFTTTGGVTGTLDSINGTVTVNDPDFFPDATFWRLVVEKP